MNLFERGIKGVSAQGLPPLEFVISLRHMKFLWPSYKKLRFTSFLITDSVLEWECNLRQGPLTIYKPDLLPGG